MTAKMIIVTALAFLSTSLLGEATEIDVSSIFDDKVKPRYVPLSRTQWQSVQNQVNTNGWCHIKEQNVLLVITNGCPNVEHLLPLFPPKPEIDLERNPLKLEGRRGKDMEPMPYQT